MKVKVLMTLSYSTLSALMDYSPSGSSVHEIIQTRILEWVVIPFSRGSSQPRNWTQVSCVGMWILYYCATWEAQFISSGQFSHSIVSDSFVTPWTAACQSSLSIKNSWSLLNLISIESVMPSNHIILCYPLLLLPSIFPSIRVFSNESVFCIRGPN